MDTTDHLQNVIDYIEANLKTVISADELAAIAGFSIYHFYRLFDAALGMPVSAYITKRRLKYAIWEAQSGVTLTDAALLYGFDTYAGFYKAFKNVYGCSPSRYLKLGAPARPAMVNLKREVKIVPIKTQIRQILSSWDIDAKAEPQDILRAGGAIRANDAWAIGEEYVLKTGRNIAGLRTHIKISNALGAEGMSAARPVKTKDGKDFVVDTDRYYVLLTRIPGSFLMPQERYSGDRVATGERYGAAIGKLHRVLKRLDNLDVNEGNLYQTVKDWALPRTRRIMEQWGCPLPEEFYADYLAVFGKLYARLPRHVIHRDPNPSNITFCDGRVSGIVDFEISECNVRLFDPCYCATGILSEAGKIPDGYEKWPELLYGILKGYDAQCKMTDEEKQAVPYVIYSIQMIFIAWLDGKEEYRGMAMDNRKMLVWIWENKRDLF